MNRGSVRLSQPFSETGSPSADVLRRGLRAAGCFWFVALISTLAWNASAQVLTAAPSPAPGTSLTPAAAPALAASATKTPPKRILSGPPPLLASQQSDWNELSSEEQRALRPLAPIWSKLDPLQKRKWLALARNFDGMSSEEQSVLQSRMTEWARLSPRQRTLARLNFWESQQLKVEDKRALWEAYQALPEEERRRLAAAAQPPNGTRKPGKLATPLASPAAKKTASSSASPPAPGSAPHEPPPGGAQPGGAGPRSATIPGLHPKTLLPLRSGAGPRP